MEGSDPLDMSVVSSKERFRVVLIVASIVSVVFAAPAVLVASRVLWLGLLLLAIDAGVFAFFYRLAKRYWIGFLFVPPLVYIALSTTMGILALLPASEVITLVK